MPWAPSPVQCVGGTADKCLPGVMRGTHDTHTHPLVSVDTGLGRERHGARGHTARGGICSHSCSRGRAGSPRPHSPPGHPRTLTPSLGLGPQALAWASSRNRPSGSFTHSADTDQPDSQRPKDPALHGDPKTQGTWNPLNQRAPHFLSPPRPGSYTPHYFLAQGSQLCSKCSVVSL